MIDLDEQYKKLVLDILKKHLPECEVRVFGSRVDGTARKFSDLDVALVGKQRLDWRKTETIKDEFSETNLPIIVDVLDWNAISPEFKNIIEQNYEILHQPD